MNLTELFLNKYFASFFVFIISFLIYCELKKPWGLIIPTVALAGIIIFINISDNSAINFLVIYLFYGFLLSIAEWIKTKFLNNK